MLALVMCALVLMLAYPLQQYLAQRAAIAHQQRTNEQLRQDVAAMQQQEQRWHDPAFLRQQARERLHFVLPGETAYVVVGGKPSAADAAGGGAAETQPAANADTWYSRLWSTVQVAGASR